MTAWRDREIRCAQENLSMNLRPFLRWIAALSAAAALATAASVAHADSVTVVPVYQSFVDATTCSFPMNVLFIGEFRQQAQGNRVHNVYKQTYTWTNPANGKSWSGVNNGPDRIIMHPDGSTTIYINGVLAAGHANVLHIAGRQVVFIPADPSQPAQILFEAGPKDPLSNLCPYLAS
jgi:hypothetical protein